LYRLTKKHEYAEISIKRNEATFLGSIYQLPVPVANRIAIIVGMDCLPSQSTASVKGGFFYVLHAVMKALYSLFKSVLHDKTDYFFPLLAAFSSGSCSRTDRTPAASEAFWLPSKNTGMSCMCRFFAPTTRISMRRLR
jgi:hypothetical protein